MIKENEDLDYPILIHSKKSRKCKTKYKKPEKIKENSPFNYNTLYSTFYSSSSGTMPNICKDNEYVESKSEILLPRDKPFKKRKIIFIGCPGVGKSALIFRFKDNIFLDYYEPTIQNIYKKLFVFKENIYELEIHDIDGHTEYSIFSFSKIPFGIQGFVLCYSIENRHSFETLKILYSKLMNLVGRDIPKVLVGNKSDLKLKREISYEEGVYFSEEINCPIIECSAKSGNNIDKVISSILLEIDKNENNYSQNFLKRICNFFKSKIQLISFIFYISLCINLIFGILIITYGFYVGIYIFENNTVIFK
jgi:Ras family protein